MKIGISTWTLPWATGVNGYPRPSTPLDAIGLMSVAEENGVSVVQLADNLQIDKLNESDLDQIAAHADSTGLVLQVGMRTADLQDLQRHIGIAARLGANVVRTVLGGKKCGRDELLETQASLRQLLPDLERHEISLALENNEAFRASEFAEIVGAIESPFVGICLDTANSLGIPETLETVVDALASQTIMLHAKDYDIQRIDTRMGFSVEGRALGDGCVDFEYVVSRLREHAADGCACIIEHWPPFDGDITSSIKREKEWLTRSLIFARSLVEPVRHFPRHTPDPV
jgi:sugar phosphate isomerase/epimerase